MTPAQPVASRLAYGALALVGLIALAMTACTSDDSSDAIATARHTYGAPVDGGRALPVQAVATEPDAYTGTDVTVEGRISHVCQKKGCWLAMDTKEAMPIRITVPRTESGGYGFTVPTDLTGWATVEGTLREVTLDAATQEHLAEDGAAPASATELHLAASGIAVRPLAAR